MIEYFLYNISNAVEGCGEFWDDGQFGKYCYQFNFQSSLTWIQARDACRQQGADLLSITSPKEQGWIAGLELNLCKLYDVKCGDTI